MVSVSVFLNSLLKVVFHVSFINSDFTIFINSNQCFIIPTNSLLMTTSKLSLLNRNNLSVKNCFGGFFLSKFAIIYNNFAVFILKGRKKLTQKLCRHTLNAESAFLGGGGLTALLAVDLWDVEVDDLIFWDDGIYVVSDNKPCAVAVGEDDQATIFSEFTQKSLFFVGFKDAEAVSWNDECIEDAVEFDFVVTTLDDNGGRDFDFIHFFIVGR